MVQIPRRIAAFKQRGKFRAAVRKIIWIFVSKPRIAHGYAPVPYCYAGRVPSPIFRSELRNSSKLAHFGRHVWQLRPVTASDTIFWCMRRAADMKWQNAVSFADRCLNFTARVDVLEAWRVPCYEGANWKTAWCIGHVPSLDDAAK